MKKLSPDKLKCTLIVGYLTNFNRGNSIYYRRWDHNNTTSTV